MDEIEVRKEFLFLRDKLFEAARDLAQDKLIACAFNLGCLYSLCNQNIDDLTKKDELKDCE